MRPIVLAMTGASGAPYAVRLLDVLLGLGHEVHLTISPSAVQVFERELGLQIDLKKFDLDKLLPREPANEAPWRGRFAESYPGTCHYHHYQDFMAGIASGSFRTRGMVICPCSMGTLGTIANGGSTNLIHRAADVHLKERRKILFVARETPLSLIHLENMLRITQAGGIVLPAMPGYYHKPRSIFDLIDFVVARICDQLEIEWSAVSRWGE